MSLDRMQRVAAIVDRTDPPLAEWLRAGVMRWERDGEDLARALELCGGRARRLRNQALCRAAALLDPDGRLGPWQRANRLAEEIKHFSRSVAGRRPPATYSPLQAALADALQVGKVPVTVNMLDKIINEKDGDATPRCAQQQKTDETVDLLAKWSRVRP